MKVDFSAVLAPKPQCLALLGPPASGKGTVTKMLVDKFGFDVIVPGNIYKAIREEDSEMGAQVRDFLKDGGICPDWMTNDLMLRESEKHDRSFIFDGYPRTANQVEFAQYHFDVIGFIHVEAPYDVLYDLAVNRWECEECGCIFSVRSDPDSISMVCSHHSGAEGALNPRKKQRWDDTPEMYPKRYQAQMELLKPLVESVENLDNYMRIQVIDNPGAMGEIVDFVSKNLAKIIKEAPTYMEHSDHEYTSAGDNLVF